MAQRTCTIDGCTRRHQARGMCGAHYGVWWKKVNGRDRAAEYYDRTCIVCASSFRSARADGKYCSDACKGEHYSQTRRTRCKLPSDHPVMLLIAASKDRERKRLVRTQRAARRAAKLATWRTARECPGCACWFTPLFTPTAVCCSKRCAKRVARRVRRAREHGARGSFTWSEFMRIAAKFNYCCAYCNLKPARLDPDHVVPLSRGGTNTPSNLLPACMLCNSSKNAMTLPEWSAWIADRGLDSRTTTWEPGDTRYSHLTDAALLVAA